MDFHADWRSWALLQSNEMNKCSYHKLIDKELQFEMSKPAWLISKEILFLTKDISAPERLQYEASD